MPLIYCPCCAKITYAYYHYEDGVATRLCCSLCFTPLNFDQVHIVTFPNDVIEVENAKKTLERIMRKIPVYQVCETNDVERAAEKLAAAVASNYYIVELRDNSRSIFIAVDANDVHKIKQH